MTHSEVPASIADAITGLKDRQFSARELTQAYLDKISREDSRLHAFLEVFSESALLAASEADVRLLAKDPPDLCGIPLAIKDNILIAGEHASAASKILESYRASYDATVVHRLRRNGAVLLGRTNMDEFAMGSSTEHSAYGVTRNPHDLGRVPGGSSGGSAAAVAAGLAAGALGSDTGGSIRQPAAFTGVVGLKPTYGTVSRSGLIAMASSLDQIGPLTRTVDDAEAVFSVIRGEDPLDATSASEDDIRRAAMRPRGDRVVVGVPREYFGAGLDHDVAAAIRGVLDRWQASGVEIRDITLPHANYALETYYIIMSAEVSANLARFDGIRYGYSAAHAPSLQKVYEESRRDGLGDEVKRRIMLGTFVLSHGYYDAYYEKAERVRRLIRRDFEEAFRSVDVIVGPTTPSPAFRIGEKTEDPLQMYLADIYTVAINLAGMPALSIPCGTVLRDEKPLPVGLQLVGPWFSEDVLFEYARAAEALAPKAL